MQYHNFLSWQKATRLLGLLWTLIVVIVAIIIIIVLLKLVFTIIAIGPLAIDLQDIPTILTLVKAGAST